MQGGSPSGRPDRARQRTVVDAWLAASRSGDFGALVALLDPDVVLRVDTGGPGSRLVRGAEAVAGSALAFRGGATSARVALVNGAAGLVSSAAGRATAVLAFTVVDGRITEIDILSDPRRLAELPIT